MSTHIISIRNDTYYEQLGDSEVHLNKLCQV